MAERQWEQEALGLIEQFKLNTQVPWLNKDAVISVVESFLSSSVWPRADDKWEAISAIIWPSNLHIRNSNSVGYQLKLARRLIQEVTLSKSLYREINAKDEIIINLKNLLNQERQKNGNNEDCFADERFKYKLIE